MAHWAQKLNVGGADDGEATIWDDQTHVADYPRAIAATELGIGSVLAKRAELVNAQTKTKKNQRRLGPQKIKSTHLVVTIIRDDNLRVSLDSGGKGGEWQRRH